MGPDLLELYEDGRADDEVAAIIRLGHFEVLPEHVRVVSQFGDIITVRLTRHNVPKVSGAAEVAGMTSGDTLLGPDLELESTGLPELSSDTVLPSDERRPHDEAATGRGVVIGIVDWGFDFAHPDFRNPDGSTRIVALWDQRGGRRPESSMPFGYGVVHDRDAINRALKEKDPYAALHYHPADADTGIGCHGTHVASIAAGSGGHNRPAGIAPDADLVLVHNTPWDESQSGRLGDSVTLLEGIDFIARLAGDRPWVINLSMGCHADQHDGSTLVERALDTIVRSAPGRAVCMSAGNYFNKRIHASGRLRPTQQRSFAWGINEHKPSDYNQLQIWYSWQDKFEAILRSPDGAIAAHAQVGERAKIMSGGTELGNVYHRGQEPNTLDNHINIFLYKEAPPGEWTVTLVGTDVIDGRFHAWIEREVGCPACQSRFDEEDADPRSTTGTICNGRRTIAVGAYDRHDPEQKIGPFSSVGPTRDGRLKPDLCAPGVAVLAARSSPRHGADHVPLCTRMSGTSMASPHVAGCVALMFQVAHRPLRIEETHNILLENARRVSVPEAIPDRIGIGFLDVEKAVEAARHLTPAPTFKQITVQAPALSPPKTPRSESASDKVASGNSELTEGTSPESIQAISDPLRIAASPSQANVVEAAESTGPVPIRTQACCVMNAPSTSQSESSAAEGPCPDTSAPHRLLKLGSVDPAVREVQRKLNIFHLIELAAGRLGLVDAPLVADCIFGSHTQSAVKAFQQRAFPEQPSEHDGVVGTKTWAKLDLVPLAPPAPGLEPPQPTPPTAALCGNLVVWINAFIPRNVPGYTFVVPAGAHAGKTAIPCPGIALPANPHCLSRGYLTDQRTFDTSLPTSQRMRSIAEISLIPPAFIPHPSAEHTTSGTTEIEKSTGAVTCIKNADMSKCSFRNFRVESDPSAPLSGNFFIRLDVVAGASDPCVNLAADIDYAGEIAIFCSPRGNVVEVTFRGAIDSFPAFEMYARLGGVTKTLFRVPPPPGNTVVNLLGGASTPVTGRVTFDRCKLVPAFGEGLIETEASEVVETALAELAERANDSIWESIQVPELVPQLHSRLTSTIFGDALAVPGGKNVPAVWEIFDSIVYPGRDRLRTRIEERFEVVAAPGTHLESELQRGDVLLRRAEGRQAHLAVLGAPELVPVAALEARGWTSEGRRPGGYTQVIEAGSRPHIEADAFARQITDASGRVPSNQIILRARGPLDSGERIDPLSLVVGAGLASAFSRPAPAPQAPSVQVQIKSPEPAGDRAPDFAEKAPAPSEVCAKDLAAFGRSWRQRDLKQGRNPRPQIDKSRPLCAGEIDLVQSGPDGGTIDLLLWNFDIDGAYPKRQHEAALDRLIFEVHNRMRGASPLATSYTIFLTGFASRTGDVAYNQTLADERERAIQTYLEANLEKFQKVPESPIAPQVAFERNPGGFDPAAPPHVESPHARSVHVVAVPAGKPPPPPRPFPVAQIEIVLDSDNDTIVDSNSPVATFVRFGLWNHGYDAAGDIRNDVNERNNFVGNDSRRFYFRVRDAAVGSSTVSVKWKTLRSDGTTSDDEPAVNDLTLQRVAAGSPVFVSKAVMLVTDDTDVNQPTHSGLTPPFVDAGVRNRGQSNHRLRRAAMDGFVHAEYQPTGGSAVSVSLPVFERGPNEERKRVKLRVINYGSHATAAEITGQFAHANARWNQIGYFIEALATTDRAVPSGALDGAGLYAGSANNAEETVALNDLLPISPDNAVTVVFVPQTGQNAYTTVAERTNVALGNRFFVFINTALDLNNETLAHELSHVLFNRFDGATQRRFFTLNTNPGNSFGLPLPDVRIRRRIQDLHTPDPNNDPANENVVNWARRTRTGRFPIASGVVDAATATTGNTASEAF